MAKEAQKPKAKRFPKSKNVLVIVASMLLASGLIRGGAGAGQAIARDAATVEETPLAPMAARSSKPEISALLEAIETREARLEEQEAALEARLTALNQVEATVVEQIAQLKAAEAALSETVSMAQSASEGDISNLTAVYENMKPKDAAALFETMDPAFAAGFLGRMRPDMAASVMAGLTPEKAYSVSVVLAGRNANAPRSAGDGMVTPSE